MVRVATSLSPSGKLGRGASQVAFFFSFFVIRSFRLCGASYQGGCRRLHAPLDRVLLLGGSLHTSLRIGMRVSAKCWVSQDNASLAQRIAGALSLARILHQRVMFIYRYIYVEPLKFL